MDLIDREALLEQLRASRDSAANASKTYGDKDPLDEDELEVIANDYDDVIRMVEAAPAVSK